MLTHFEEINLGLKDIKFLKHCPIFNLVGAEMKKFETKNFTF
jgi:hypothetical protein